MVGQQGSWHRDTGLCIGQYQSLLYTGIAYGCRRALAYCLVLLLYLSANRSNASVWLSFFVGVLAVVTLEFHVVGVLYLLALGVTYLVYFVKRYTSSRRISLKHPSIICCRSGPRVYSLLSDTYANSTPRHIFIISQTCFECDEGILSTEIKRLLRLMVADRPIELLLLFAVMAASSAKLRSQQDLRYLLLVGGWIASPSSSGTATLRTLCKPFLATSCLGRRWIGNTGIQSPNGAASLQESRRRIAALLIALVILVSNLAMFLQLKPPYIWAYEFKETPSIN